MSINLTKRLRESASTFVILILLAGVLGFYYLKYVPERRSEFNRNAFLELNQIQDAFQFKTQAYRDAIRTILKQDKIDITALIKFNYRRQANVVFRNDNWVGPIRFDRLSSTGRWQMFFPVYADDSQIYPLSISMDTLMSGLVSTYKDIFDGYLLIRDYPSAGDTNRISAYTPSKGRAVAKTEKQIGKIIYQSGDLSMDYLVNPDSLLKKNERSSLLNIQDITIAGNTYKLFLFPFEIGDQKLTLSGLISDENYRETNQKIPFSFFAIFTVLLLLLLIHLPILRIYILSPNERVRDTDIRLIIGSYFIAAFFGFFLFTKIFLDKEQSVQNKKHLEILSDTIIHKFYAEIDSVSRQLSFFDSTLENLCGQHDTDGSKTPYLTAMTAPPDSAEIHYLDRLFKPRIYPYANNVFWINESGKWVARWSFKTALTNSPLLDVQDRQYFKDFKNKKELEIPDDEDSIAIQPILSKLEGEYRITVARKSKVPPYTLRITKDSNFYINPFLVGISSNMPSVSCVILPPGYGFSIIDEAGNILYDSKGGRPMLSNILKEMEDPEGIRQSAVYHNQRYFENLILRGNNTAFLSRPLKRVQGQLLVYYNLSRSDKFQEHLIGLSAGLIAIVISLLILSALINQWSKTKARMLESRSQHFEWLHPSSEPLKQKYYLHLIRWMLLLLAAYLLAWVAMEACAPCSEFSLLFISLLFPFYIALHYYELRERYYDVQENRTGINWYFSRPSLLLRGLLLIIIILINCFTSFVEYSASLALPVLITQLVWAGMIVWSTYRFKQFAAEKQIPDAAPGIDTSVKNVKTDSKYKIPTLYVWAILTGVILISIIPASGIFWLFLRQEKGLYQNADYLTMAKQIDLRKQEINQHLKEYKFNLSDPTDRSYINAQKFSHGIYMISGRPISNDSGTSQSILNYPSPEYIQLHKKIFPTDSLNIAWIGPKDSAYDGTWYFAKDGSNGDSVPALVYQNRKDGNNPKAFRLTADSSASWNTASLMIRSFSGTGTAFPIFFIVGLCFSLTIAYYLTLSLSKRIFLTELQIAASHDHNENTLAEEIYQQTGVRPAIGQMILETCQQPHIPSLYPKHSEIPISDPGFPRLKDIYYFEKKLPISMLEAKMPWLLKTLDPVYSALWKTLSDRQKFLLYDFALDGFANYKAGKQLQELMGKGLLFFDDLCLSVMTLSFQEYILQMKEDPDINTLMVKSGKEDTWNKFKSPLLIILTAVGLFIFITQEDIYRKLTGILATLITLLPMLSNLLNKPPGKGDG